MFSKDHTDWLGKYYQRIVTDCTIAFERRDRIAHWSYVILAALIGVYAGFHVDGSIVPPVGRFILITGILAVFIRLLFQSMVAYGYFIRGRYLRTEIEKYWMDGEPSLEEIKEIIKTFDHGKRVPRGRNRLLGQLRYGFILILAVPTILWGYEMYYNWDSFYPCIIFGLIIYLIYESWNFDKYDQTQLIDQKSKTCNT